MFEDKNSWSYNLLVARPFSTLEIKLYLKLEDVSSLASHVEIGGRTIIATGHRKSFAYTCSGLSSILLFHQQLILLKVTFLGWELGDSLVMTIVLVIVVWLFLNSQEEVFVEGTRLHKLGARRCWVLLLLLLIDVHNHAGVLLSHS